MREEDAASLQQNCFSANTVQQTAAIIRPTIDGSERGESAMFVAEADGDVLGTCTVERLQHHMCRHRADIVGFVITPTSQGTGLARKLVDTAGQQQQTGAAPSCRSAAGAAPTPKTPTEGSASAYGAGYLRATRDGDQTFDEVHLWKPITPDRLR